MSKETVIPWGIGERVFGIETKDIVKKCPFCGGQKEIQGQDGTKESCPRCWGEGEELFYSEGEWVVKKGEYIDGFNFHHDARTGEDRLTIYTETMSFSSDDCFRTKAEALAEAKRRNDEGIRPSKSRWDDDE